MTEHSESTLTRSFVDRNISIPWILRWEERKKAISNINRCDTAKDRGGIFEAIDFAVMLEELEFK